MAEKLDKVDILLEEENSEKELSLEMQMQSDLETAERYINIAEHMNQFEDQDKYYTRAIQYIRKARNYFRDVENNQEVADAYTNAIEILGRLKFTIRSEGKIGLYEEACRVRDTAKTPSDYYNAQTIFERIHKYELNHAINPKWITPELYEKTRACEDSEQQATNCRMLAEARARQNRRHSLVISIIVLAGIAGLLAFSRTVQFRYVLAVAESIIGDHESSWEAYKYVYDHGNEDVYEKYIETRYLAAKDAERLNEIETAVSDYRAAAQAGYKDSEDQLLRLELERLRNPEKYDSGIGKVIPFGNVNWRILKIEEDKVFLLKESAMKKDQVTEEALFFHDKKESGISWENSWIRHWLNDNNEEDDGRLGFLGEQFTPGEQERILSTELPAATNPVYLTKKGNATTDKIFLLTSQEVEYYKYMNFLPKTETCWWLRTPGCYDSTMAFVFTDRTVMNYGYDVTSDSFTIKPCMWVDIR